MQSLYNQENHTPSPAPKSTSNRKPSFEKYVDPTGEFESKELRHALWYVKHKLLLYRLLLLGLVLFSIGTWAYSLWRWGDYVIFGITADQQLASSLTRSINYSLIHPHFSPQPLGVISTQLYAGGVDKYDAVADIANTNNRWRVDFDYSFVVDGRQTPAQHTWLLPGEHRPLAYFGVDGLGVPPSSASLKLDHVSWQRISNKRILDTKNWQAEHLNFTVSDFKFYPLGALSGASANVVQFTLTNQSPYGYVAPDFYVALMSGDATVGFIPLQLSHFASQEARPIDLRSFTSNLAVTDIKIIPLIDVYNDEVYLPPPT